MSRKNPKQKVNVLGPPDKPLFIAIMLLVVFGLIMLASASTATSQVEHGNPYYFVSRQLMLGVGGGLFLGVLFFVLPHRLLQTLAIPGLLGALGAMLAVFIPGIGVGSGGAHRWINMGPITIQPAELLKIAVVIYLAAWLAQRKDSTHSFQTGYLSFLGIMGIVSFFLVLQPDISTLGVILFTALAMYFAAGARINYIAATLVMGTGALLLLIRLAPYRVNRILAFLNPGSDPLGIGWQVNQAMLAIGSGGLFGRGLGFSREKLFWLPESFGDAIFAVLSEELGFAGGIALIGLFIFFAWRGFRIARALNDSFLSLLAFGVTALIIIQALLNIGGIIALLPLMGITLPFFSYGSSSLVITLGASLLLLSLSRATRKNLTSAQK